MDDMLSPAVYYDLFHKDNFDDSLFDRLFGLVALKSPNIYLKRVAAGVFSYFYLYLN